MHRLFNLIGPLCALLAVAAGAFGTHALRGELSDRLFSVYQTAVEYHFYHALGLILIALARYHRPESHLLEWSGWLMFGGLLLFSGSLYVLALADITILGMITPFGGLLFLTSWLLLAIALYQTA